ncbi:hypothetical protein SAMN04487785_11420 [Dyella jiangningensis]|uniref:hypothetical protein n=1 Tax=Dyella sp. AtDHG13 TaxID=1938897 RepID=UPI00087E9814|nr:hypothetical protein [Dyella sp. AtDHG13]PXV54200.1 hypothetical protein BDW41_113153 [Dyella sp. AtDHG13]SDL04322.1 hypothetical protein SAMN04487785_11420 [Dyella jiangningensis]
MNVSLFGSIGATLKTAQDAINVALESRDLIKNAAVVQQLSAAQHGVLSLTAQLFELQNKYLETAQELADLKKSLVQRNSYALFEISKGIFVYRLKVAGDTAGTEDPGSAEPEHYICQPCMDTKGVRAVLLRSANAFGFYSLNCPICDRKFATDEKTPRINLPPAPHDPFGRLR